MEGNNELPPSTPTESSRGNAPRQARVKSIRIFGTDISTGSGSVNPIRFNTMDDFTSEGLVRALPNQNTMESNRASNDETLLYHCIGETLRDPRKELSFPEQVKHQAMERALDKYNFRVVYPMVCKTKPVADNRVVGQGKEYLIGHENNQPRYRVWIDRQWPLSSHLTPEQQRDRFNAEMTLNRSLQAMKYLHKHRDNAIFHVPSGAIYLSPHLHPQDLNGVINNFHSNKLPKLIFKDDRLHFKTSDVKKARHRQVNRRGRGGNGRSMEEETSSEEEE